jgi:hypothetical protein
MWEKIIYKLKQRKLYYIGGLLGLIICVVCFYIWNYYTEYIFMIEVKELNPIELFYALLSYVGMVAILGWITVKIARYICDKKGIK